jgi:hypothetical protein
MPGADYSVVIPTRNRPQLVGRLLAALRTQSRPPKEVIVVDQSPVPSALPSSQQALGGEGTESRLIHLHHAKILVTSFDERLRPGKDWEFVLRATRKFELAYLNAPLTVLRFLDDTPHFRSLVGDKGRLIRLLARARRSDRGDEAARAGPLYSIVMLREPLGWPYLASARRLVPASSCPRTFAETGSRAILALVFGGMAPGSTGLLLCRKPRPAEPY